MYDLKVQWDIPTTQRTDSRGNTFNLLDREVAGYTLEHDVTTSGSNETITITGINNNEFIFRNVVEGTYTFSVRSFGRGEPLRFSVPHTFTKEVKFPAGVSRLSTIAQGGEFDSPLDFNKSNGKVTVINSAYNFKNTNGASIAVSSASTAQKEQSFSAMSSSSTAFWFFDHSSAIADTPDPWKAVQVHTDSTANSAINSQVFNFTYLKELGASNNGLSVLSSGRTISITNARIHQPRSRVILTLSSDHGLKDGDTVTISSVSGMTQLNSQTVILKDWPGGANEFLLRNSGDTEDIDGSTYSDYSSGGTLTTSSAIRGNGEQFGNVIRGKNTAFTTDFSSGDIIKISTSSAIGTEVATSEYAEVDYVIDNHTISLVTPLTRAYTDAYLYQQTLKVDRSKDSILAELTTDSNGAFDIKFTTLFKSLDTADGGSIIESASTETSVEYLYSSDRDKGKVAQISMTNTRGISATPTASAEISGQLGYKGPDISVSAISSQKNGVFTTGSAHGLLDNDIVQISGIAATDAMSAINGSSGSIKLGSGSLVTGTNTSNTLINAGSVFFGSGVSATVTNCPMESLYLGGSDATCTFTASGSSGTVDSITTGGSGFVVGDLIKITVASGGTDHEYFAVVNAAGVVSNDLTTKFRIIDDPGAGGYFSFSTYIDTSAHSALSGQSTIFANKINPLTLEMVIGATFDAVSQTIPNASITDAGRVLITYASAYFSVTIPFHFFDIKEAGVSAEALIEKHKLFVGAVIRQGTASAPTFHGHVSSVAESGTDGTVRVLLDTNSEQSSYTSTNPVIRAINVNRSSNLLNDGETLGAVGPGDSGTLTFTNITHSSIKDGNNLTIAGRSPSGATFDFTIANTGVVTATGDGIGNAQGSEYDDGDIVTFTAADLNTANSSYATTRGDLIFRVDTNGTPSASADATLTFTGSADTTVATVSNLITEPGYSTTTTLRGELPTKSTDNYDVTIRGFLEKNDGFEPSNHSNFDSSSGVTLTTPDTLHGLVDGAPVNIYNLVNINSDSEFFVNESSTTITIFKDSGTSTALVGTGLDTPGTFSDPTATTFVRGSQGYVLGRCATFIDNISLQGALEV